LQVMVLSPIGTKVALTAWPATGLQVNEPKEKEAAVMGASEMAPTDKVVPVTCTFKGDNKAFKAVTVEKVVWILLKTVAEFTLTVPVVDWENP